MRKIIPISILALIAISFTFCKKDSVSTDKKKVQEPQEEVVLMHTAYGDMYIWLYNATPLHKQNFLKLAKEKYYDSTTFHRVIAGFMIQGGDPNSKDNDPNNDGMGGPGYTVPAEISDTIKHERGALAAARTNNPAKASSGSQFYICLSTPGTSFLDNQYTVYGYVMKGMECADSIVAQPKGRNDRPIKNQYMKVEVVKMSKKEIKEKFNYDAKL